MLIFFLPLESFWVQYVSEQPPEGKISTKYPVMMELALYGKKKKVGSQRQVTKRSLFYRITPFFSGCFG